MEEAGPDLITSDLEDLAVLDSARAGGFAGTATEALVEVRLGVVPSELPVDHTSDEVDASARGIEFVAGLGKGWTVLKAESTSDALGGEILEMAHRSLTSYGVGKSRNPTPPPLHSPISWAKRGGALSYFLMNFFLLLSKPCSTFLLSKCQTGDPERW